MSEPLIKYKHGKTCVFWDIEDYPIPDGHDPLWVKEKLEEVLKKEGYFGEISIRAYVREEYTNLGELQSKYLNAGIKLDSLAGETEEEKISSMLVDIYSWAGENNIRSNLIVLSKQFGRVVTSEEAYFLLEGLYIREFGVLLSNTEPDWELPCETNVCGLTSLFDGGAPSKILKRKRDFSEV